MKRVATVIINRNLPDITNKLFEHINKYDGDITDIYVLEAGSDFNSLSKYSSWHANWPDAIKNGLRYCRGVNFALCKLIENNLFDLYDAFFLITNDTELPNTSSIIKLLNIFDHHPRLGILSPCCDNWGEKILLKGKEKTLYFWFIHNNAYFLRKEFILDVCKPNGLNYLDFLLDGNNFRGYGTESELIAKAFINDWAAGITSEVFHRQNNSHILQKADLIKTDPLETSLKLAEKEGREWMFNKYGFRNKWDMHKYVKCFYDKFFDYYPEYLRYKV